MKLFAPIVNSHLGAGLEKKLPPPHNVLMTFSQEEVKFLGTKSGFPQIYKLTMFILKDCSYQ